MKMKRRYALNTEYTDYLKSEISNLKSANAALEKENLLLKQNSEQEHKLIQYLKQTYEKAITDAKNAKAGYEKLMSETLKQRKQFENQTAVLLKKLKRQK